MARISSGYRFFPPLSYCDPLLILFHCCHCENLYAVCISVSWFPDAVNAMTNLSLILKRLKKEREKMFHRVARRLSAAGGGPFGAGGKGSSAGSLHAAASEAARAATAADVHSIPGTFTGHNLPHQLKTGHAAITGDASEEELATQARLKRRGTWFTPAHEDDSEQTQVPDQQSATGSSAASLKYKNVPYLPEPESPEPMGTTGFGQSIMRYAVNSLVDQEQKANEIVQLRRMRQAAGQEKDSGSVVSDSNLAEIRSIIASPPKREPSVFQPGKPGSLSSLHQDVSNMSNAPAVSETKRQVLSMSIDPDEHFLLADLDPDKDALIFGSTREEFYENVEKTKKLVLGYQRWETKENHYYYMTWVLRLFCFAYFFDVYRTYLYKELLANSYDDFVESVNDEIGSLEEKRERAVETACEQIKLHPPNFEPLIQIRERKLGEKKKYHPMDTTHHEERQDQARKILGLSESGTAPTNIEEVRAIRRVLLPQSADWSSIVKKEIAAYRQDQLRRSLTLSS